MEQQNSFERPVISITCKADADTNFLSRHYAEVIEAVGGSSIILPHTENRQVLDMYLSSWRSGMIWMEFMESLASCLGGSKAMLSNPSP